MKLDSLRSKYPGAFTTSEAKRIGVSPQLLRHYLVQGEIERISHGVYRFPDSTALDLETQIKEKLKAIPHAIVSHHSALQLYGLSEESPPQIDLTVSDANIPKRKLIDVKLHPITHGLFRVALTRLRGIPVTTLERTLVDLLRSGESISQLIALYREAQSKRLKISLPLIRKIGKKLHAKARTDQFLEALL